MGLTPSLSREVRLRITALFWFVVDVLSANDGLLLLVLQLLLPQNLLESEYVFDGPVGPFEM